ncbi:MAG: elongation factor Ts [Gracilibacter sp. BRH_c7a]|nr:MAG: elongation factor Ts [Gracilibacter sp. BRH_c7a]
MNIGIEQIDEMRKRTNCSYQEAKELLEKHDGNLIEAIVEFEKNHGSKQKSTSSEKKNGNFGKKVKDLIQKGFITRFVIEKEENTILNIPINILILAVIITMPLIWIYPIIFIAIYFMGYKIRIRKEEGQEVDINELVDGLGNKVRTATDKMREKTAAKDQNSNQNEGTNKDQEIKSDDEKKEDGYNEIIIK